LLQVVKDISEVDNFVKLVELRVVQIGHVLIAIVILIIFIIVRDDVAIFFFFIDSSFVGFFNFDFFFFLKFLLSAYD
jgi:hypothetical protein